MNKPIWIPDDQRKEDAKITTFMRFLEARNVGKFENYTDLYNWSISQIEKFWSELLIYSGLEYEGNLDPILEGTEMFQSKWFQNIKLNFAENLLRFRQSEAIALISLREGYPTVKISYSKLFTLVVNLANHLKKMGVAPGDRVAGFVTNTPEAVIASLAVTSLGAIWTSCSPDFGITGVIDRFGQIEPKVMFAVQSYSYQGKVFDCTEKIFQITERLPDTKNVILIPAYENFVDDVVYQNSERLPQNWLKFSELITQSEENEEFRFEKFSFNHPVYIMYSSGTTGKPKCIVHGAGGTLLQHYKELVLHTDLRECDKIFYFTTCGWMMWNWLISSLMTGATVVLYDGSPMFPDKNTLWRYADELGINIFGTSPKFLSMCEKENVLPKEEFKLSALRTILSTGSPLSEQNYQWVYKAIKSDVLLSSISGGTDIISCFMLGCPILPVYSGEIQCRGLGMAVEVFDENGKAIFEEKGELVCTRPFPSMPLYFWNDPDGTKYYNAYFNYFHGIWRHGDYVKLTANNGVIVYGRSDATLNPGGVRIGTAEIYRVVEGLDEIIDSIVVGINKGNDIEIILFVVLNKTINLTDELIVKIKNAIKTGASPRHVPAKIISVPDIPRTISGKKVELAVTRLLNGLDIDNKDALANPEALRYFYEIKSVLD